MEVTATPTLPPAVATAPPLTVTIPAGAAVPISWSMTAPEKAGPIAWTVEAVSKNGNARDRLVFEQTVEAGVPIETRAGNLRPEERCVGTERGRTSALRGAPDT